MMDNMDVSNLSVPAQGRERNVKRTVGHKKCRSIEKKNNKNHTSFNIQEKSSNQQRKLVRRLTEDLITQFKNSANISPRLSDIPSTPFIGLNDVINKPKLGLACSQEVDSEWIADSFGSMIGLLKESL